MSDTPRTDDEILYTAQLSWWAFLRGLLLAGAVTAGGLLALYCGFGGTLQYLGVLALIGPAGIASLALKKQSISASVTARHVIVKNQLVSLRSTTLNLHRIESVDIKQTLMQRLLGYGDVVIRGLGSEDIVLVGLVHPERFKQAVLAVQDDRPL